MIVYLLEVNTVEKSNHKYYGKKIPYEELTNFIEPIEVYIPISLSSLSNFTGYDDDALIKLKKCVTCRYSKLYSNFPFLKSYFNKMDGISLKSLRSITYTPHLTGYDFRFHPVEITNSIFHALGYDYTIPFINLDDKLGMNYLKDYTYSYCNNILKKEADPLKRTIVFELKDNYDKICEEYNEPANIKDYIIPKDTLFFLAYRSLDLFEKTDDYKYLFFAKEYYEHVSKMETSEYPHMIYRQQTGTRVWFDNFRKEYEEHVPKCLDISPNRVLLKNSGVLIAYEILKPGEVEKVITDTVRRSRASSNVDYKKYQKLFEEKMNFYLNSPRIRTIMGLYGLRGYMGFLYNNEYLVFDKFYNGDTEDKTKKTILTHGEAIYTLPSDKFELLTKSTKQEIIEEKKRDLRIRKFNHNNTFVPRVQKLIDGPNVSTSTFDIELEKVNKKMLIINRGF